MSKTKIETKIAKLVSRLKKIPDEFWVAAENGKRVIWILDGDDGTAGSYESAEERIGITQEKDVIWGFSSGCSCWNGWESGDYCPTMNYKEFTLVKFQEGRNKRNEYSEGKLRDWKADTEANLNDFLLLVADEVSAEDVLQVQNAEIRRYLIKRVGYENIKDKVNATVLHTEGDNELLRFENGEMYVKVRDSSTDRDYLLFVEGNHLTCKSAIAWTFGLQAHEYNPIIET